MSNKKQTWLDLIRFIFAFFFAKKKEKEQHQKERFEQSAEKLDDKYTIIDNEKTDKQEATQSVEDVAKHLNDRFSN